MGSSLDQIGPITTSVEDAEMLFTVMCGRDEKDATTISSDTYTTPETEAEIIGVPQNLLDHEGIDESVRENFQDSLHILEDVGYEIKDIEIPGLEKALEIYYIIMPAEVSANLARFDGVKFGTRTGQSDLLDQYIKTRQDGFGEEVKRRILVGTYVLSAGYYDAYYRKAVKARKQVQDSFQNAFADVDVIATPTTPTPAFAIGENTSDPLEMYAQDMFTVGANIAGLPALSVPSGYAEVAGSQLPLGLHLQGARGDDRRVLSVGKAFQREYN
jgi:aspartyl-tRNA(Asn)/glutamyl-tRNA(Gln) amidotransferase subunit A